MMTGTEIETGIETETMHSNEEGFRYAQSSVSTGTDFIDHDPEENT